MTYVKKSHVNLDFGRAYENCCQTPNILKDTGYMVCTSCGTTFSRAISKSTKNLPIYDQEKNTRQNEKVYSPYGPRTLIKGNRDGKGNYLSPEHLNKYRRLAKINRGLIDGFERNLYDAIPKMTLLNEKLKIPSYASQEAYRIYLIAAKKKLALGRSIEGLIAASIMCALRIYKIPRSWDELAEASQVPKKILLNCFKKIYSAILPQLNINILHISPENYLSKFRKQLDLSMRCQNSALNLIKTCKKKGMDTSGKDPKGYGAAALYLCAKLHEDARTQKEVCKISQISEVTLRERILDLKKYGISFISSFYL